MYPTLGLGCKVSVLPYFVPPIYTSIKSATM